MPQLRRRNAVLEALERFRRVEPGVSLTHVMNFLYVCENEGLNVAELAEIFRTTRATASRTARALAEPDADDSLPPHLGLVEVRANPDDFRGKVLFLTAKGAELRDEIDGLIRQGQTIKM
jgi:DNA-binding MarR family transcriptional regulator